MKDTTYESEMPKNILKQAINYKNTLHETMPLPINRNKSMFIEEMAEFNVNDIKYHIDREKYQNNVFKRLEEIDQQKRKRIHDKLSEKETKILENKEKGTKSKRSKHEAYSKHLSEVKRRFADEEMQRIRREKDEAEKLRKEIKEFYEKEEQRKLENYQSQGAASPEYSTALWRLNAIQRKNEEFSTRAESDLEKQFNRSRLMNKTFDFNFRTRRTSFDMDNKTQVYETSLKIQKNREKEYIQKMAQNEEDSMKAVEHKDQEKEKVKKRIHEFFKKKIEKWQEEKRRNDLRKSEIPEKCQQRIEKVHSASYRKTESPFRTSFTQWVEHSERKREEIKEIVLANQEKILQKHVDTTLRNKSSHRLNETMLSMKNRATKVSKAFS